MVFPKPQEKAIIYRDEKLYVVLASNPLVKGHTIVVWNKDVKDLHILDKKEYEYLMNIVDKVRDSLMSVLNVKKVYLMYMDEANHVHWHLIPRYNIKGYELLKHKPSKLKDFSLVEKIKKNLFILQ